MPSEFMHRFHETYKRRLQGLSKMDRTDGKVIEKVLEATATELGLVGADQAKVIKEYTDIRMTVLFERIEAKRKRIAQTREREAEARKAGWVLSSEDRSEENHSGFPLQRVI